MKGLVYVRTENVKELAVDLDHVSKTCPVSKYDVLQEESGVRFLIIRGDTVLFDQAMQGLKTGALPESVK